MDPGSGSSSYANAPHSPLGSSPGAGRKGSKAFPSPAVSPIPKAHQKNSEVFYDTYSFTDAPSADEGLDLSVADLSAELGKPPLRTPPPSPVQAPQPSPSIASIDDSLNISERMTLVLISS